jgi:hypothetical protein
MNSHCQIEKTRFKRFKSRVHFVPETSHTPCLVNISMQISFYLVWIACAWHVRMPRVQTTISYVVSYAAGTVESTNKVHFKFNFLNFRGLYNIRNLLMILRIQDTPNLLQNGIFCIFTFSEREMFLISLTEKKNQKK